MTARPLICLAAAALLLGAAAETAHATAPGRNGPIAFRRFLGPDRTLGAIFTIAPDGSAERQVTSPPAGASDDFPDYAADGSLIAFHRCGGLLPASSPCAPTASRVRRGRPRLRRRAKHRRSASTRATRRSRRTSKWVAFQGACGRIVDDTIDHQDIFVVRTDGTHLRRVTFSRKRQEVYGEPQWSPDGRRLRVRPLRGRRQPGDLHRRRPRPRPAPRHAVGAARRRRPRLVARRLADPLPQPRERRLPELEPVHDPRSTAAVCGRSRTCRRRRSSTRPRSRRTDARSRSRCWASAASRTCSA